MTSPLDPPGDPHDGPEPPPPVDGRLTGIVLPSFDDEPPAEAEADARPVRVVPSGPPPAWPPPEPQEPAAAAPVKREFPRFIHGELVLPAATAPAAPPEPFTEAPSALPTAVADRTPTLDLPAATLDLPAAPPPATPPRPASLPSAPPPIPRPPAAPARATPPSAQAPHVALPDVPTAGRPAVPVAATWAPRPADAPGTEAPAGEPVADRTPSPAPADGPRRGGPWQSAPHPAFPEATARTFRILPIAADLLPTEISATRHVRRVRRLVVIGVAAVVALVVGWYVMAAGDVRQAQDGLADAQLALRKVNSQQNDYKEQRDVRRRADEISAQLRAVMAQDLSWSALLTSLQSAAPKGVRLTGVTGSLDADAPAGAGASPDRIGLITLTGVAPSKAVIATYVDTLGAVGGIADPFLTDANQDDEGVTFTIRMDITKAALGGRFSPPSATPSASGGK
ncbi:PilN domain-containing protein [Dactylosporangium sucinum]|uniref:Fimbrial assembly family protein n=1 Tax=Dactylosporangium sucinum TaxID=1424081 RepID=A0A917TWX6_9ACTN|nr:PilN domain-containing protein [Dactylosporangium sucinum]GGM41647.1 hypothetical protein GCM10007977_048900 [Dactylosporangium sucinum]